MRELPPAGGVLAAELEETSFLFIKLIMTPGKSKIDLYVIEAIRRERMAQKISQVSLAFGINKSRGFIAQVENPARRSRYNLQHINDIARYLCVSPRQFLPDEAFENE